MTIKNKEPMTTNSSEIIKIGQLEIRFLLESSDTNGQLTMFEFLVPAGAKVASPHYHEKFDEVMYELKGVLTLTGNGRIVKLEKGQSCFIPKGIAHGFNNTGKQDARALAVSTPGLMSPDYFRKLAGIINAGGPPDMQKVKEVFRKYGLVPVINPGS
jgi:quercetin dioxygenase-like cupin family protein